MEEYEAALKAKEQQIMQLETNLKSSHEELESEKQKLQQEQQSSETQLKAM